jgi:hypothetical protein
VKIKKYYIDSRRRNIQDTVNIMKANWVGHILPTNYLLKQHVIEGNIKGRV